MIDFSQCFHLGVRVPDLDAAMAEIGGASGVTWCVPQERQQAAWVPGVGETLIPLRFTYSSQGPQHIELLQGEPGSIWDGRELPGPHHVGVWCDDVAGETNALVERGWAVLLGQRSPADGYGAFTYVQPPNGLIVELVGSGARPMFERWFAGGPLA